MLIMVLYMEGTFSDDFYSHIMVMSISFVVAHGPRVVPPVLLVVHTQFHSNYVECLLFNYKF